jgi:hypothetical protein
MAVGPHVIGGGGICLRATATREPDRFEDEVMAKDITTPAVAVPEKPVQIACTAAESVPRLFSTYPPVVVIAPPLSPVAVTVVVPIAVPVSVGVTPKTAMASPVVGCAANTPAVPVRGVVVVASVADRTHPALAVIASSQTCPASGVKDAQNHSHEFGAVAPGVTVGAGSLELAASLA